MCAVVCVGWEYVRVFIFVCVCLYACVLTCGVFVCVETLGWCVCGVCMRVCLWFLCMCVFNTLLALFSYLKEICMYVRVFRWVHTNIRTLFVCVYVCIFVFLNLYSPKDVSTFVLLFVCAGVRVLSCVGRERCVCVCVCTRVCT